MRTWTCTIAMSLMLFVVAGLVGAVPLPVTYQGALTGTEGSPVNGTRTMTFSLYEAKTGGAPLWTQTMSLPVENGVFTAVLGQAPNRLPDNLAKCNFLQVAVGGTVMSPRHRLASVPYALVAGSAQTATVAAKLPVGTTLSGEDNAAILRAVNDADTSWSCALRGDATGAGGVGVRADADASPSTKGLYANSRSTSGVAVYAEARAMSGTTRGVYSVVSSPEGRAVEGDSDGVSGATRGVYGHVRSPQGVGVLGVNTNTDGGFGVKGEGRWGVVGLGSASGVGVLADNVHANGWGLQVVRKSLFEGPSLFQAYATFAGGHGDLAENYRGRDVEAGDVVVIGPDGQLTKCTEERDSTVAGIVSTQPSMKLNGRIDDGDGVVPLALVGRVACKVDATRDPIKAGDLLTTSGTPGHAMKCTSRRPPAGTIIGKALGNLDTGTGVIQVLVTLR